MSDGNKAYLVLFSFIFRRLVMTSGWRRCVSSGLQLRCSVKTGQSTLFECSLYFEFENLNISVKGKSFQSVCHKVF